MIRSRPDTPIARRYGETGRKALRCRARGGALLLAAALAAPLALATACREKTIDSSPVGVTRRFAEAVGNRDNDAVWALLGPATRARLTAAAKKATALGGGKPKVAPQDLLAPAWRSDAEPDWKPTGFRLLGVEGPRARVEVTGAGKGERAVVYLVKHEGHWRVELGEPPPAPPPRP